MPLERAKVRQEELEKMLLSIGEMEVDLLGATPLIEENLIELMSAQLTILSYLALNVRDCIMLLNRENPDGRPPDNIPQVEWKTSREPGAEPGADKEKENE